LFLVALVFIALGCFYYFATNNLKRAAAIGPTASSATTFSRQTYPAARQKFDRFFADSAERSVTFSNAEVNAMLAESPELHILRRGVVVILGQNTGEVSSSLPLDLPLLPRRYLNCSFQVRPTMRGEELDLGVSRIERDGKSLGAIEVHQYQFFVVPFLEKTLSNLNRIQWDRSIHNIRIENGNIILVR
jgi:hypothetical protein